MKPHQVRERFGIAVDVDRPDRPDPRPPTATGSKTWSPSWGVVDEWGGAFGRRLARKREVWVKGFGSSSEEEPATPYFAPSGVFGRRGRPKRRYLRAWLVGRREWLRLFSVEGNEPPVCETCRGSGARPPMGKLLPGFRDSDFDRVCLDCEGSGAGGKEGA